MSGQSTAFSGQREQKQILPLKEKRMSENDRIVFGGVDTHRDTHVAAAVDATGRVLGTSPFDADAAGYEQLGTWLGSWGRVARVGIEGTGSYGAGLSRHLLSIGVEVAEVNRRRPSTAPPMGQNRHRGCRGRGAGCPQRPGHRNTENR